MNDPQELSVPVLPVKNVVLFPNMMMPLVAGRPGSIAAVEAALDRNEKQILIATQRDASTEQPSLDGLFEFGTLATINRVARNGDAVQILVQGAQRVRLIASEQAEPYLRVRVRIETIPVESNTEVEALQRAIVDLVSKATEFVEGQQAALMHVVTQVPDALQQAYLVASLLGFDTDKCAELLAANSYHSALHKMHEFLVHEVQVLELRNKISSTAASEIGREQREYYLRQQLRAIREELGESGSEQAEVAELRARLKAVKLPDDVRKEAERELGRLDRMSPNAADYQLTRTYLELVLELPWFRTTDDNLDLRHARSILDADHFELREVKNRIIEHLAVMKLNPGAKAPILCFVGPPGVGKTSLGRSIARALGRKFERIAMGGLHDEAELRGHRRTYIGAMPGRIIQAVRRTDSKNPVLMLDEVDKLGRDFRGDPAAALMEILDPEQNAEFHDNYLDLSFDLSKVLFVTTANTLDGIPRPLLDRMEVLRLTGYSGEEKHAIARRYLIPRQIREVGLGEEQLKIPDETLRYLIGHYTREAGVRELERTLGRIARKVATQVVENSDSSEAAVPALEANAQFRSEIRPDDLSDLLGPERFYPEKARKRLPPGVAAGLAWTEAGGDVLYVEAVLLPNSKELKLTGQLGDVMKESAVAAQSFLLSHLSELDIASEHNRSGVHVHVPAGATPKDGPSAGVTMATALASLLTDLPVRSDTAMTGEITLSGLVLPVGGIKEKVLAAHRSGIRRVILPKENERDLREIPKHVRESMEFHLAERIEDVLTAAIPDMRLSFAHANRLM